MKYVLYIDYKAGSLAPCDYKAMEANNLADAILEADELYAGPGDNGIYLVRIMELVGKPKRVDGMSEEIYEAVLCKRSNNWHRNDIKHSESRQMVKRTVFKDSGRGYYELVPCHDD